MVRSTGGPRTFCFRCHQTSVCPKSIGIVCPKSIELFFSECFPKIDRNCCTEMDECSEDDCRSNCSWRSAAIVDSR